MEHLWRDRECVKKAQALLQSRILSASLVRQNPQRFLSRSHSTIAYPLCVQLVLSIVRRWHKLTDFTGDLVESPTAPVQREALPFSVFQLYDPSNSG